MIILKECGLIMGDEDKSKWEAIGHWGSIQAWEFKFIIVPLVEMWFISLPLLNKHTSIGHNILSFVAINVHAIPSMLIFPIQFLQLTSCCSRWNQFLVNPLISKNGFYLWTCNKIGNILHFHKPFLGFLDQFQLDFTCNVLIVKNCPMCLA